MWPVHVIGLVLTTTLLKLPPLMSYETQESSSQMNITAINTNSWHKCLALPTSGLSRRARHLWNLEDTHQMLCLRAFLLAGYPFPKDGSGQLLIGCGPLSFEVPGLLKAEKTRKGNNSILIILITLIILDYFIMEVEKHFVGWHYFKLNKIMK